MTSSSGQTRKKQKGPRPRHVPQRTCVVCRETSAKRTLYRIVRESDSVISADPTGKKNGRGAYICDKQSCWDKALTTNVLARALRATPDDASIHTLKEFAATLTLDSSTSGTVADSKESAT